MLAVEIQEPVLRSVLSELRYPATPRFIGARGELIERLRTLRASRDWNMAEQFVQVFTDGEPDHLLQVSAGNMAFSFETLPASESKELTAAAAETVLETLGLDEVSYVGVRSWWLAAADSFEDLRDHMVELLATNSKSILEPVGQKPSDAGWVFEFRTSQPEHVMRIGPMGAEQAAREWFRDKEPGNYPPHFLFVDIDRHYNGEVIAADEVLDRWDRAFDRCLSVAEDVMSRLRLAL
jgi:hypothetical protein